MTAATPGQALHDALRESAAIEFDLDIESFERWEYIRPSQRNRLEAAAQAAIGWQRAEDATPTAGDFDHAAEIMRLRGQIEAVRTLAENAAKSVHAEKVWLAQAVLDQLADQ